jgi:hypothetical protein
MWANIDFEGIKFRKYCNVLGVLYSTMELYCTPKSQYTTVKYSRQICEHKYTSYLFAFQA